MLDNPETTEKPRVLLVDDDERLLTAAKRVLRKELDLDVAVGAKEAIAVLSKNPPYQVIISDQSMPDINGIALLKKVAERWPNTVRIMLTGNADQDTAREAVNTGQVFRFIRKPCQPDQLLEAIVAAVKHYNAEESERLLLERTLMGSVNMLTDILALSRPEFYQRSQTVQQLARHVSGYVGLKHPWQLHLAASLCQLGIVVLPENIASHAYQLDKLSREEAEQVLQAPMVGADLVRHIPRLEPIANGILYSRKNYDGSGLPSDEVKGEELPLLARILHILLDLVELTHTNQSSYAQTLQAMVLQTHKYDMKLFETMAALLLTSPILSDDSVNFEKRSLTTASLVAGDLVAVNIQSTDGKLLLSRGSKLTEVTIQRLRTFARMKIILGEITVLRPKAV
jgi:response regulator RpfG family c-di-GMP phosphodiesterase